MYCINKHNKENKRGIYVLWVSITYRYSIRIHNNNNKFNVVSISKEFNDVLCTDFNGFFFIYKWLCLSLYVHSVHGMHGIIVNFSNRINSINFANFWQLFNIMFVVVVVVRLWWFRKTINFVLVSKFWLQLLPFFFGLNSR